MEIVHIRGMNTEQIVNRQYWGGAKDPKGSQFTATTETYAGRKYVESVQKVSRPLLNLVQFKCIFFTSFLLSTTK
jgi:hypothetical protein